ncbi:MAG: tetratricopeptide repeat protein [Candidatus Omnitrophica bacterium]|nr:tetratricopeptide repeat protein [Candidatus Omnitrophota bacterium]
MRNLRIGQKIILVVFGVISAVILLEAILSLLNFYSEKSLLFEKTIEEFRIDKNTKIVFCIGDSFTYGVGASFEHSYPGQLEKILNGRRGESRFKVFNLGVPGYDSDKIILRFKRFLKKCSPDVVIAMIGVNDTFFYEQRPYDEKINSGLNSIGVIFLERLRKFDAILRYNLSLKLRQMRFGKKCGFPMAGQKARHDLLSELIGKANYSRSQQRYEEAFLYYKQALAIDACATLTLLELGRCYKLAGEYEKAQQVLADAFKINPDDVLIQVEIQDLLINFNGFEKNPEIYWSLYKLYPYNKFINQQIVSAYFSLAGKYLFNDQFDKAREYYQKAAVFLTNNNKQFKNKEMLKDLEIMKNTFDNLCELAAICRGKNILLLFSGYPEFVRAEMGQAAKRTGVVVVDHAPIFEEVLKRFPREKYFIADGHCTEEGYRIMAENVADKIVPKFGIIEISDIKKKQNIISE